MEIYKRREHSKIEHISQVVLVLIYLTNLAKLL